MRASIQCPTTAATISIDIRDDRQSVFAAWDSSFKLQCPHCDQTHLALYRDLYVDAVLAGFQGDFDGLLAASAKP